MRTRPVEHPVDLDAEQRRPVPSLVSLVEASALPAPPSWRALAKTWLAFVAIVLVTAAIFAVIAPDWLAAPTRTLPDTTTMVVEIASNNLLIAIMVLLGGWLAAAHLRRGRRATAVPFALLPALVMTRSLLTVGAVGGADLPWLASAARWWLLEFVAYATVTHTALWLIRHPDVVYQPESHRALRRALVLMTIALVVGAVVEVFSA